MIALKTKPIQPPPGEQLFEHLANVTCLKGGEPVHLKTGPGEGIRRILVSTDFSDSSEEAVARAADLARRCDATLTIVHVIDINSPAAARHCGTADELMKGLWDAGLSGLRDLTTNLAESKTQHQTRIVEGLPAEAIVGASAEYDLMVIGRQHSRSPWSLFSRHTVQRVMQNAECPVLVVDEKTDLFQNKHEVKTAVEA